MRTRETVPLASARVGEIKDVVATLIQSVPNLTVAGAQNIIGNKRKFIAEVRAVFSRYAAVSAIDLQLTEWRNFYREVFGLDLWFDNVAVPQHREGFDRLLVIAQGLTLKEVFRRCQELFQCEEFAGSLDRSIATNDRVPKHLPYAMWIRDRVGADEELKNLSALDVKVEHISGITLMERLIFELTYWKETRTHLDIQSGTLCAGSRDLAGRVPKVLWDDDRLSVQLCPPDFAEPELRTREVIA